VHGVSLLASFPDELFFAASKLVAMFVKVESDQARWKRSQDQFLICLSFSKGDLAPGEV